MTSRTDLMAVALDILSEYRSDGLDMTLRQLYYQCVARGYIANSQREYKRLGSAMTEARYAGECPPDALVDRGRDVGETSTSASLDPDAALDAARAEIAEFPRSLLWASRWHRQPKTVSVWVEKEALAGVFERPCRRNGLGLFSCKGYPSVSALWSFIEQLDERPHVVLYFGDCDPDGWQIPRSAEEGIRRLAEVNGCDLNVTFERVALNLDQVREFDPPPFPAKPSSARFARYLAEHGTTNAWELDALDPRTLGRLIDRAASTHFDTRVAEEVASEVRLARNEFIDALPDQLDAIVGGVP